MLNCPSKEIKMEKRREEMIRGVLTMPRIKGIKTKFGSDVYENIENMFNALWKAYLNKGAKGKISSPYWAKRIGNIRAMNIALKLLSDGDWIISKSIPGNNWGEVSLNQDKLLQFVDADELNVIRKEFKYQVFELEDYDEYFEPVSQLMRIGGKVQRGTIARNGFAKAGKVPFKFDVKAMEANKAGVIKLVNKGILKSIERHPHIVEDMANYETIGKDIVNEYIAYDGVYMSGQNILDPRGRNIAGYLNKIGNPVGYKVMRALLKIPKDKRNKATDKGLESKFMFIAELNGFREGTKASKIAMGKECYYKRILPDANDLDELPEAIWCERTYADLDKAMFKKDGAGFVNRMALKKLKAGDITIDEMPNKLGEYKWKVPVEIDMSASVLAYIGLLLNHKPFMERTNMIGDKLNDAWGHNVIRNRLQFKTIMRQCYGSSLTPAKMWDDMGISYTNDELIAFTDELEHGELAVAVAFKDFIINNCNPQADMLLEVDGNIIPTKCNHFHNRGEKTLKFDLYDTASKSVNRIHHTDTVKVPDLDRFRKYMVTGLIHGLDNQVEDKTVEAVIDAYGWAIDIHDAVVLCAEATEVGRETTAKELEDKHANRNKILSKYFTSIGIPASKLTEWNTKVVPLINKFEGNFKCNKMVLK